MKSDKPDLGLLMRTAKLALERQQSMRENSEAIEHTLLEIIDVLDEHAKNIERLATALDRVLGILEKIQKPVVSGPQPQPVPVTLIGQTVEHIKLHHDYAVYTVEFYRDQVTKIMRDERVVWDAASINARRSFGEKLRTVIRLAKELRQ